MATRDRTRKTATRTRAARPAPAKIENRDPVAENRDPVPQSTRPNRVMVERKRPRCPRCGSLALVMDGGTYKMANGRTIHYATCRDCRARAAVVDV